MKLSALEIKSQEFKRALRGLDEAEVQSFLDMVASQWQEVQEESRRMEERVRELEHKIVHYQKIEEALQEALTSAKASSKATVAEAERSAELIIKEAEIRARALAREAESRVLALHESTTMIGHRRKEIVARLGAFLRAEIEMLDDYRENSAHDRVPTLPSDMQGPLGGEHANTGEFEGGGLEERSTPVSAATVEGSYGDAGNNGEADSYGAIESPNRDEAGDEEYVEHADEIEESDVMASEYVDDEIQEGASDAYDSVDDDFESVVEASDRETPADLADERAPVEHQFHSANDGGFEAEGTAVEEPTVSSDDEAHSDDDELTPEHTEWRIRRILDNLE